MAFSQILIIVNALTFLSNKNAHSKSQFKIDMHITRDVEDEAKFNRCEDNDANIFHCLCL